MESFLGYNIDSDFILQVGVGIIKLVLLLTFFVLVLVIALRLILLYHNYWRDKFISEWRPALMQCVLDTPDRLPKLNHKYINYFIGEWNSLYQQLGGTSHENLIETAMRLKIYQPAIQMLISKHIKIRLTGIITLGNMRYKPAWKILERIATSDEIYLSIAAYRALILIDEKKALSELFPILIRRSDWPPSMVIKILKDADNSEICELIEQTSHYASEEQLYNLVQYINSLNCACASRIFQRILTNEQHGDHLKSACLKELSDPSALDLAYKYISSNRWHVRMNAAVALGNIGTQKDIPVLTKLLADKKWWVRYRAAQALINCPFITDLDVIKIKESHHSEKAKLMIDQAIAEKGIQ